MQARALLESKRFERARRPLKRGLKSKARDDFSRLFGRARTSGDSHKRRVFTFVVSCASILPNMRAFIERVDGEFRNANIFTAWQESGAMGFETLFFAPDEVEELQLDAQTPVVAGIPIVWRALRTLGVEVRALEAIPHGLETFAKRDFGECSLGEIRRRITDEGATDEGTPVFIKPRSDVAKLFPGHVVARFKDLIQTASCPGEMSVWWSDALELKGEFRGFVLRGELMGWRHYFGDFRSALDFSRVESAIQRWKSRPVACAMDWALTANGETVLVEVNDAYSLGCYGLASHLYAPMLAERWRQIVETGHSF